MKSIADILNSNIPDYLQNRDNLVSYLNSVGIFLDETRQKIINFDFSRDYEFGVPYTIKQSLESFGFEIPPLLAEDLRRIILRDAVESFIKTGTEDSILWVLRVIGLEPEIRYAWLPSAREVRKGYMIDPVTKNRIPYHPDQFTHTQLLYGDAVAGADGVYFEGYSYSDFEEETKFGPYPILGELYETVPDEEEMAVAKTPYVVVRVQSDGYNTVTDPYIGDDGIEYEYSEQEAFKVVNDLLEYFLFKASRPVTVKVIIIVALQILSESIAFSDDLDISENDPPPHDITDDSTVGFMEECNASGLVNVQSVDVGEIGAMIGDQPPFVSQLSVMENPITIGEAFLENEVYFPNWKVQESQHYMDISTGESSAIILKALSEVEIFPSYGVTLEVRAYENNTTDDYDVIATVSGHGQIFLFKNSGNYHYLKLKQMTPSTPCHWGIIVKIRHNVDLSS